MWQAAVAQTMTFTNGPDATSMVDKFLPIIAPMLSAGLAAWGTVWLQDRAERKKQKSVAHALLADIRKVEKDLGPIPDDFADSSVGGLQTAVPDLSVWVRDLMLQIAEKSPLVVGLFLDLQRYLETLKIAVQSVRAAAVVLQEGKSALDDYEKHGYRPPISFGEPKGIIDPAVVSKRQAAVEAANGASQTAITIRRSAFLRAKQTVDALIVELNAATHS
jgi:hypothetical protein